MAGDECTRGTERLIQDELSEERMFAGLAVGSYWYLDSGKQVQIRRIEDAKDHGIRFVRLVFDLGQQSAEDFLTQVKAKNYEPVGHRASQAQSFALRSVDTGTDQTEVGEQ